MSTDTRKRSGRSDWLQIITTALVGLLSVVAVMLGVFFTNKANVAQQRLTEQGQVTERFGNDMGLLGSKELDVRVGGTYALERLMHDSPADEAKIVEVLSAFIRDHTPESLPAWSHATTSPCRSGGTTSKGRPSHPSNDAQAALQVLGRRPVLVGNQPHIDIDLTWADIAGASLLRANLDGADLRCTGLARAYLIDASLRGASLRWAYLTSANLTGADLTGAHLLYTDLTRAKFIDADLTGADLTGAKFTGAKFTGAKFTGANLTGALWPTGAAVPKGWQRGTHSGRLKRAATSSE
jgi:Pentapeptide repeats (8 copies)